MRIARLLLALFALFPVTVFVSAQPAMAQANCRWDLDGLWVGERNRWRVNIKARPGGYVVWADGTPEPGQGVGDYLYKQTSPKLWTFTFPDGDKATMQLDAAGLLQTRQPAGPETFKRVRPAGPPKCVPLTAAVTPPPPAPAQPVAVEPSRPKKWIAATKASSAQTGSAFDLALAAAKRDDFVTALQFYKQACDAGDGNGCTNAGLIHYLYYLDEVMDGKVGSQNLTLAARFHARGCIMGSAAACFNQGALYEFGVGTDKNPSNAKSLYLTALDMNPNSAERATINAGLARLGHKQTESDNSNSSLSKIQKQLEEPILGKDKDRKSKPLYYVGGTFEYVDDLCSAHRKFCISQGANLHLKTEGVQGIRNGGFLPNGRQGIFHFIGNPFEAGTVYEAEIVEQQSPRLVQCQITRGQQGVVPAEETAQDPRQPVPIVHVTCRLTPAGRAELERASEAERKEWESREVR